MGPAYKGITSDEAAVLAGETLENTVHVGPVTRLLSSFGAC
ncbi:hypothetical protein [Natronosalvus caseinilyticus]|nr:hypothetical protein [Natronosalvus caseinilyticus]